MLQNLTGLRFFLAIWVVLYHVRVGIHIPYFSDLCHKGYWAVDVFFVLSGFVIALNYSSKLVDGKTFKSFLVKRFARLFPVHWFTLAVVAVFLVEPLSELGFHMNAEDVPFHIFNIHAWGVINHLSWNIFSWSISAEWFAYLFVFPVTLLLVRKLNKRIILPLALLAWCAFVYICEYHNKADIDITYYAILRIIPEFLFGMWLHHAAIRLSNTRAIVLLTITLLLVGLAFFVNGRFMEYMVMPVAGAGILLVKQPWKLNNLLFGNPVSLYLGKISYSLYMTQLFGILLAVYLVGSATKLPGWYAPATILFTFVFAVICYHLVEAPCRKFIVKKWG